LRIQIDEKKKKAQEEATWSKPSLLSRSHSLSLQLQGAGESGSTTFFLFRIKVESLKKMDPNDWAKKRKVRRHYPEQILNLSR
jgi:hypothetical protein